MARIAIIGAAGYVGMELIRQLKKSRHEVIAIARDNGIFLLKQFGIPVIHPQRASEIGTVDIVLNLAYPNSGSIHQYSKQNKELLSLIVKLSGAAGKIIHTSTQAVFGYGMDIPQQAGPVKQRHDYLYIQTKIELENMLFNTLAHRELHIVRLGNVWGPASPTWTAALANRLLFLRPVAVVGNDGYSNITDVANAASYLAYLVDAPSVTAPCFHHVAELGAVRWSYWINKMSEALSVKPNYHIGNAAYPTSFLSELKSMLGNYSPLLFYRSSMFARFTGSPLRSVIKKIPTATFSRLKRNSAGKDYSFGEPLSSTDASFLSIVSTKMLFSPVIDDAWSPVVDCEESWARVEMWLREAGYISRLRQIA